MSDDKSEAPSQRRLQKAREEGRSAVSREMSVLASMMAGLSVLAWQTDPAHAAHWLQAALVQTHFDGARGFRGAEISLLMAVAGPAAASLAAYAGATLLQTGFLLHTPALQPDLSRISPLSGVKRLLGPQTLVQLLKSVAKLAVLGCCLFLAIKRALPALPQAIFAAPETLLHRMATQGRGLILLMLGGQAAIALADLFWERRHHMAGLRQSIQEQRDEHKESEGNPQVKHRVRHLARQRAKRRMMAAVPKAAVIITNPTHYAVALAYERGSQEAPKLVAKGADEMAARIRELGQRHRIPVVANPPLARALFTVELDAEIPAEHFRAVAEVIAFIWKMRSRAGRL
jgi:flagellar biosynthetic protein FlhB